MKSKNIIRESTIKESLSFSIAIPCFNEEQNIGDLLKLLCSGWNSEFRPEEIAVFSSECNDKTEEIVRNFVDGSSIPVILSCENKRSGKCHAINQLMDMIGDVDVIILVSGDIQVSSENLIKILKQFKQKNIGVVAGRPIPVCDQMNMAYRVQKTMWDIHHLMVLQAPKSTEVTAFRNLGFRLDENSLVDEAEIERNLTERGYLIKYCPEAIIHNKAPMSLSDYIRQRTRVTLGHLILKRKRQYTVGSLQADVRITSLRKYFLSKDADYLAFAILLIIEAWVLLAGNFLANFKSSAGGKWARIKSAKKKFQKF